MKEKALAMIGLLAILVASSGCISASFVQGQYCIYDESSGLCTGSGLGHTFDATVYPVLASQQSESVFPSANFDPEASACQVEFDCYCADTNSYRVGDVNTIVSCAEGQPSTGYGTCDVVDTPSGLAFHISSSKLNAVNGVYYIANGCVTEAYASSGNLRITSNIAYRSAYDAPEMGQPVQPEYPPAPAAAYEPGLDMAGKTMLDAIISWIQGLIDRIRGAI